MYSTVEYIPAMICHLFKMSFRSSDIWISYIHFLSVRVVNWGKTGSTVPVPCCSLEGLRVIYLRARETCYPIYLLLSNTPCVSTSRCTRRVGTYRPVSPLAQNSKQRSAMQYFFATSARIHHFMPSFFPFFYSEQDCRSTPCYLKWRRTYEHIQFFSCAGTYLTILD